MSVHVAPPQAPRLNESQRKALISLLADEDSAVFQEVREKLLGFGPLVVEWLKPYTLNSDPVLRRRTVEIIRHFTRHEADNAFLLFCLHQGEDCDLEEGIWLLARTQYPEINQQAYRALLDSHVADLLQKIDLTSPPREFLSGINDFFFNHLGYSGNENNYYDPDNSFLNRVMDRRTGNPVTLCALYLLLTRRLRLPMTGIGLPGHFICRYQSSLEEVYVDVFNRGRLLSKSDCIRYLQHTHHGLQEGFLSPLSSRRILFRICSNLRQIFQQTEALDELARMQRYLAALAR